MGGTRFMVQWEEHPSHLATRLGQLLEHQTLVDVTLMCNTHTLRVHRAVLAACSPYFETILQRQLGMHPLIVLKDMQFSVLKSLIEFMYCGETSVTEDNLGALLQAAKFFQVKGLSAMTKEALGLVPNPKTAVNGDAARKAFVGRPKRVGIQPAFMTTSSVKSVSGTHTSGELVPTKTFQTVPKPVPVTSPRPDTQQQTESAQLLLSLSGSEFPKQTFHTVSKNVRFHHNISSGVTVEPSRSLAVDAKKDSPSSEQTVAVAVAGGSEEGATVPASQPVYLTEPPRKRGRPVKRQMNVVFQEKVLTDADMALHKEAEASRKALEMLRQEMKSDTDVTGASTSSTTASNTTEVVRKLPMIRQTVLAKLPATMAVTPATTTTSQTLAQPVASAPATTTVVQKKAGSNILYKVVEPAKKKDAEQILVEPPAAAAAMELKEEHTPESILPDQIEVPAEQVFQLAAEAVETTQTAPPTEEAKEDSVVEYQVAEENAAGQEVDLENAGTNIVYQMADTGGTAAGSVMSQYMEVLKEAGLPTDVPILLDSGDGSYVTVNEEVLMNIVNGGVLQCHVTEGNFVAGEGIEFVVQEMSEAEVQGASEVPAESTEAAADPGSGTKDGSNVGEVEQKLPSQEYLPLPNLDEVDMPGKDVTDTVAVQEEERKTVLEEEVETYYTPEVEDTMDVTEEESVTTLEGEGAEIITGDHYTGSAMEVEEMEASGGDTTMESNRGDGYAECAMDVEEERPLGTEVITGDRYGESAMEGFPIMKRHSSQEDSKPDDSLDFDETSRSFDSKDTPGYVTPHRNFVFQEESTSCEDTAGAPVKEEEAALAIEEEEGVLGIEDEGTMGIEEEVSPVIMEEEVVPGIMEDSTPVVEEEVSPESTVPEIIEEHRKQEIMVPVIKTRDTVEETKEEDTPGITRKESAPAVTEEEVALGIPEQESAIVIEQEETVPGTKQEETVVSGITEEASAPAIEQEEAMPVIQLEEEKTQLTIKAEEAPLTIERAGPAVAIKDEETSLTIEEEEAPLAIEEDETLPAIEEEEAALTIEEEPVVPEEASVVKDGCMAVKMENSEMSVEEALQEMMGEGSDTEVDVCDGNTATSTVSHEDGDSQTMATEQRSPEQEAEELRLVLGPEEERTGVKKALCREMEEDVGKEQEAREPATSSDQGKGDSLASCDEVHVPSPVEPSEDLSKTSTSTEDLVVNLSSESNKSSQDLVLNVSQEEVSSAEERLVGEDLGDGAIVSPPNKDIPFAVGLLPLKTALEKLQAMPEYHPRKTRSSSTGKESAPDAPPARVKRKAASVDGPEKKQKTCEGDEQASEEDIDVLAEKHWQDEEEDDVVEEQQDLHSMPELLTESTEG